MVTRIPKQLDLAKAITGYAWEGELPLSEFPRLLELLETREPTGSVKFRVDFSASRLLPGEARIQASAVLPLQCQRSLQGFDYAVDVDRQVGFVTATEQLDRLSPEMEPSWLNEGQVNLRDLIEDELILAIPDIPLSDDGTVPAQYLAEPASALADTEATQDSPEVNPFAVLKKLKGE
jgi:uncharacterized protein